MPYSLTLGVDVTIEPTGDVRNGLSAHRGVLGCVRLWRRRDCRSLRARLAAPISLRAGTFGSKVEDDYYTCFVSQALVDGPGALP